MQYKDEKTVTLAKTVGAVVRKLRHENRNCSINQFAHEYDLDVGNTSRVENGSIDVKFVTLWRLAEALQVKPSFLVHEIELAMGDDFHFYDI